MKITTRIDREKNIRYNIVQDDFNFPELADYLNDIYNLPDFDSEINVFWDLMEADFSSLSSEDVRSIKEYVSANWGKDGESKCALVVSGEYQFGMTRMFQLMMEVETTNKVAVFKDREAAIKWIGAE